MSNHLFHQPEKPGEHLSPKLSLFIRLSRLPASRPVFHNGIHLFLGPINQRVQPRQQRLPTRCQRILHLRRNLGIDPAVYNTILLQRPQSHRQHLLRNIGNSPLEFAKSHDRRLLQRKYHQYRPFVADTGQDVPYRAIPDKDFIFLLICFHNPLCLNHATKVTKNP